MELLPDRTSRARTREEIMESESPPEPRTPVDTNSELHKRARQVGRIAGQTAALVREARRKAGDSGQLKAEIGTQIEDIRSRAASKVQELSRTAAEQLDDLRETTAAKADEWRRVAQERSSEMARRARIRLEQARNRADRLGHQYPWHFVIAGAIVGFLMGAALRVRRANRGY